MAASKTLTEPKQSALNGNVSHGASLLKRAVSALGAKAVDERSVLALELKAERAELIAALGGPTEISPQEIAIIEMAPATRIERATSHRFGPEACLTDSYKGVGPKEVCPLKFRSEGARCMCAVGHYPGRFFLKGRRAGLDRVSYRSMAASSLSGGSV